MARYRNALPQLDGDLYLTDGGLETTLIFNEGVELPHFATFHLLQTPEGEAVLRRYFRTYAALALPDSAASEQDAEAYHRAQVETFSGTAAEAGTTTVSS